MLADASGARGNPLSVRVTGGGGGGGRGFDVSVLAFGSLGQRGMFKLSFLCVCETTLLSIGIEIMGNPWASAKALATPQFSNPNTAVVLGDVFVIMQDIGIMSKSEWCSQPGNSSSQNFRRSCRVCVTSPRLASTKVSHGIMTRNRGQRKVTIKSRKIRCPI